MNVDIYLQDKGGKRKIRIPILPEKFTFSNGDTTFISSDIMSLGEVATPSGSELGLYSWESEFPGPARSCDPMLRGAFNYPNDYLCILRYWKRNKSLLNLLITGYTAIINVDVYLKEFSYAGAGAAGDISYEIALIEARNITITTTKVKASETPKRQAYSPRTYTVVAGDDLWTIATRFYGDSSKWEDIFQANKKIIEQTSKERGTTGQGNAHGHWIYPGQVFVLP